MHCSTSSPSIITAAEVTPPSHHAFLAVRPYSTEYATRTMTDPKYIRTRHQGLQAQYRHTHMVYTMSLTTLPSLPLSSTHTHAFNAHSSNARNMAMKQWHVAEISIRQPARLISDKHLPAFLLNTWVLGIRGFWYTCDRTNLYCIRMSKLVRPPYIFIHIQSSTCENLTGLNHGTITSVTN
jgi:hypothetical protein